MNRTCKLKPGDVINGTYEVNRILGSGYSGTVCEARHRILGASFAVKLMHAEDAGNEHKESRWGAEASTVFHLQHEHIVRVLDANQTPEGLLFIVMELLKGQTLTERMAQGRLHPLRALKYAYDLASGLAYAHEHGVIHRDVKPDNVFVTLEDVVKLIDWTAAKFAFAPLRSTEPRNRVGTLAFMPPEFLSPKGKPDGRMDQYSLAHLLYMMLRGVHGFEHRFNNDWALIEAVYKEQPAPLAEVAGLPDWIDELLAPALAKRVEKRYETMPVFARRIHEAGCRLARQMRDGRFVTPIPLGDPPIDFEGGDDDAKGRKVHVAATRIPRGSKAPKIPSQRVSVAPGALPEGGEEDEGETTFDAARTRKLPAKALTTALTLMSDTIRRVRPSSARGWMVPAALALALPAAAGAIWRWGKLEVRVDTIDAPRPSASTSPSANMSTSASTTLREPDPARAPAPAPVPEIPGTSTGTGTGTSAAPPPPPKAPAPKKDVPKKDPVILEDEPFFARETKPPPSAQPAPAPPPAPTAQAKHRVFGTDD